MQWDGAAAASAALPAAANAPSVAANVAVRAVRRAAPGPTGSTAEPQEQSDQPRRIALRPQPSLPDTPAACQASQWWQPPPLGQFRFAASSQRQSGAYYDASNPLDASLHGEVRAHPLQQQQQQQVDVHPVYLLPISSDGGSAHSVGALAVGRSTHRLPVDAAGEGLAQVQSKPFGHAATEVVVQESLAYHGPPRVTLHTIPGSGVATASRLPSAGHTFQDALPSPGRGRALSTEPSLPSASAGRPLSAPPFKAAAVQTVPAGTTTISNQPQHQQQLQRRPLHHHEHQPQNQPELQSPRPFHRWVLPASSGPSSASRAPSMRRLEQPQPETIFPSLFRDVDPGICRPADLVSVLQFASNVLLGKQNYVCAADVVEYTEMLFGGLMRRFNENWKELAYEALGTLPVLRTRDADDARGNGRTLPLAPVAVSDQGRTTSDTAPAAGILEAESRREAPLSEQGGVGEAGAIKAESRRKVRKSKAKQAGGGTPAPASPVKRKRTATFANGGADGARSSGEGWAPETPTLVHGGPSTGPKTPATGPLPVAPSIPPDHRPGPLPGEDGALPPADPTLFPHPPEPKQVPVHAHTAHISRDGFRRVTVPQPPSSARVADARNYRFVKPFGRTREYLPSEMVIRQDSFEGGLIRPFLVISQGSVAEGGPAEGTQSPAEIGASDASRLGTENVRTGGNGVNEGPPSAMTKVSPAGARMGNEDGMCSPPPALPPEAPASKFDQDRARREIDALAARHARELAQRDEIIGQLRAEAARQQLVLAAFRDKLGRVLAECPAAIRKVLLEERSAFSTPPSSILSSPEVAAGVSGAKTTAAAAEEGGDQAAKAADAGDHQSR